MKEDEREEKERDLRRQGDTTLMQVLHTTFHVTVNSLVFVSRRDSK